MFLQPEQFEKITKGKDELYIILVLKKESIIFSITWRQNQGLTKDWKSSHRRMMDEQVAENQNLKADLKKTSRWEWKAYACLEISPRESLIALKNFKRQGNLQFMNIP